MPDDRAKIEEARRQTQVRDPQGNSHRKPPPPPVQTIKKGAWTNPETHMHPEKVLRK